MDEFWQRIIALAEQGQEVLVVGNTTANNSPSKKERIEYTTSNRDDANRWAKEKRDEGYSVSITFDNSTGIYLCVAIR